MSTPRGLTARWGVQHLETRGALYISPDAHCTKGEFRVRHLFCTAAVRLRVSVRVITLGRVQSNFINGRSSRVKPTRELINVTGAQK